MNKKVRRKDELEEFKYLIDSRNLSEEESKAERDAILKAREQRFRNRSGADITAARLMQLKFLMEDYADEEEQGEGARFPVFLKTYVDTLYRKRIHFAKDLSIKPVMLSQVLGGHRDPQEMFLHRLIIHTQETYKGISTFPRDLWPRVFYRDKVWKFMEVQNVVMESEAKYVTGKKVREEE
jgi:hypothetical protein